VTTQVQAKDATMMPGGNRRIGSPQEKAGCPARRIARIPPWAPLAAICSLALLAGCSSSPPSPPATADQSLRDLRVQVEGQTTDRKFTYLEIGRGGRLSFAGGRQARQHLPTEVMVLSDEQLRQVRQVVDEHRLFEVKGSGALAGFEESSYRLKLRAGGAQHTVRSIDGSVPGVKALHDLLFGFQAEYRYNLPGIGPGPAKAPATNPITVGREGEDGRP
jgi:hypothetical protein